MMPRVTIVDADKISDSMGGSKYSSQNVRHEQPVGMEKGESAASSSGGQLEYGNYSGSQDKSESTNFGSA
jgi:hypothetical protein